MRTTHTYVVLEISAAAYQEIADKLRAAGYDHAFDTDGQRELVDMRGIALAPELAGVEQPGDAAELAKLRASPTKI